jgi:hypothetical protein
LLHFCGDELREDTEACDGADLDGQTCASLGFYGQTKGLACGADCNFDTSGCAGRCGDGIVNGSEACDGAPPPGKSCLDYGFERGLLGCSSLCAVSVDACGHVGWQPAPLAQGTEIWDVWGRAPDDVFAVGDTTDPTGATQGISLHWDGATWSTVPVPTSTGSIGHIWASGPDDLWAISRSDILRWDGARWNGIYSPNVEKLDYIWGSSASDVYVVGEQPLSAVFFRWNGTSWSSSDMQGIAGVTQLWGSGPDDVYLLGASVTNSAAALHWDGAQWQPIALGPYTTADTTFNGIWGSGPNDVYAVTDTQTLHWDGMSWAPVRELAGGQLVWGTGADDVFVVTQTHPDPFHGGSLVTHWDGGTWTVVYSDDHDQIVSIWKDRESPAWFVSPSGILKPQQAVWSPVVGLTAGGLWGTGEDVFLIELLDLNDTPNFGRATKGHPFTYLQSAPPNSTHALWGNSPNDIWAIGKDGMPGHGSLWHWDGATWGSATSEPETYLGLGGSGPDDVWAVGYQVSHWDGKAWSAPVDQLTPDHQPRMLGGVWSRSANDAIAVGSSGWIEHWDGKSWADVESGVTADLIDVWGSDSTIFAVGKSGTILRERGGSSRWEPMAAPTTADLMQIKGSSLGNLFVGGSGGVVLHLRGGAWEPIATPPGLGDIFAVWATPTSLYVSATSVLGTVAYPAATTGVIRIANMTYRLDLAGVDCHAPERDCTDGWDNDCDGLQDGDDPDCKGKVVEQCANLADDDGDGLVDCKDPDCAAFPTCRTTMGN